MEWMLTDEERYKAYANAWGESYYLFVKGNKTVCCPEEGEKAIAKAQARKIVEWLYSESCPDAAHVLFGYGDVHPIAHAFCRSCVEQFKKEVGLWKG